MVHPPTPLRALGARTKEGTVLLRAAGSEHHDAAVGRLSELLSTAPAFSSTSDALLHEADSLSERYHLDPARANILRPLTIPDGARVLEIGAGCGAVTRYLGESSAVVDALEPDPSRAHVARLRTKDLDNVEVFVGGIEDVPAQAAYDLVVVIGALEYVGAGSSAVEPYRDFLQRIFSLLKEGGSLALAGENNLGVKYLAGAAESHTGRPFDSLESYPRGSRARTFSRREIHSMVSEAGLKPRSFVAFPDHKITRTVLDAERVSESHADLLHAIPTFPSPDRGAIRPRLADERRLWQSLVAAGLGGETGNAFLVLAGKGEAEELWPRATLGAFYSTGRREPYQTETRLCEADGVLTFRRTRLAASKPPEHGLELRVSDAPHIPGHGLLRLASGAEPMSHLPDLLQKWAALVRSTCSSGEPVDQGGRPLEPAPVPLDLVPHNIIVGASGELVPFDQEWFSYRRTTQDVIHRGILWTAIALANDTPPTAWDGCETVGDIARRLGPLVGLDRPGHWITPAVEHESGFQAAVQQLQYGEDDDTAVTRHRDSLLGVLGLPLECTALGIREGELRLRAEAAVENLTDVRAALEARLSIMSRQVEAVDRHARRLELDLADRTAALDSLNRQLVVRISRRLSLMVQRVAPPGTGRRAAVDASRRKGGRLISRLFDSDD